MSRTGLKCPSGDTLSAFVDGEVKAPWDQALARHVDGCPACLQRVGRLRRLHELLAADPTPQPRLGVPVERGARPPVVPLWKRRVALPLPAAAAAALAILALGVALAAVGRRPEQPWMSIRHGPAGTTEVTVAAPVEDLEQLLRTLDQAPRASELVIQLPADSRLIMVGEPQLLREAEFSRGHKW